MGPWVRVLAVALVAGFGACAAPNTEPEPLPPGTFAFGVFGDGPYRAWEEGRFKRLIEDVNTADLGFLVHVGDILWYPCSDDEFRDRLDKINRIRHPVIYTPGDNEWTDCHEAMPGRYLPLERLASLRKIFFPNPHRSLGARPLAVRSQADDPRFSEFVENARWRNHGFLFVTVHTIETENTQRPFEGRTEADDVATVRRIDAAVAWLDDAFDVARSDSLRGVVIAAHAAINFRRNAQGDQGLQVLVDALEDHAKAFSGPVLFVHGDWHELTVDHPLADRVTGKPIENFTRLQTYGSPDIGWVRVVVDTVSGQFVRFDPRLVPRRFFFW